MSPVQQRPPRSPRSMVIAVGGIVLGIALVLVVFVLAIPSLTESDSVQVNLGDDRFTAGNVSRLAPAVDDGGPLLLPDVANGQRDIYLQHLGATEDEDWLAFDARRPGQSRDCTLEWQAAEGEFVDPCDGTVVPADGEGLISYPVEVTEDGEVIVDLNPDDAETTDADETSDGDGESGDRSTGTEE